jgi:hypothetical protein
MTERTVVLRLNQQQLELIDRTIQRGEAGDRVALVKRALAEHAIKHGLVKADDGRRKPE